MGFKGVHPTNILSRVLALDLINQFKAKDIYKVNKEAVIIYEGENGDEFDVNWHWCLFKATLKQLDDICQAFQPKNIEDVIRKEEQKSLILDQFGRKL